MLNSESNFNLSNQISFGSQLSTHFRKSSFSFLRLSFQSNHFVSQRFHVLLREVALQLCLVYQTDTLLLLLQEFHFSQLVVSFHFSHVTLESVNQACILSN